MAVSNTRYLSSSETRVNTGIRGWKLHLSESTIYQESVGGICFSNEWMAASLQPLTFSNHCYNAVFSNASPGLTVCLLGLNIGVFWKRVSRPIGRTLFPVNSPTFFVCTSIVNVIKRWRHSVELRKIHWWKTLRILEYVTTTASVILSWHASEKCDVFQEVRPVNG